MRPPLNRLAATELLRMLAARDVTCETVTHTFLDAVEQRESEVRAFAWIDADRALNIAREFDRGAKSGRLAGLPVAVKDVIDTAGIATEHGSSIYAGHVPRADAACIAAVHSAGGYVFGKTVTAEFANFTPGPTCNPHVPEHTPGGSSSGSAAAVAAHMAPFALGTQTAGSVIRPASFCGVVGFVPTRGLVPRTGVLQVSDTLDVVGCFANSVQDAGLVASAITLRADLSANLQDTGRASAPRVAWTDTPWAEQLSSTMGEALASVVRTYADGGAVIKQIRWPSRFTPLADAQRTVQVFETARALAAEFDDCRDALSPQLAALIEEGRTIDANAYLAALRTGRECAASIDELFADADVVLAPSAPGEAPHGLGSTGDPQFNRAWQLLGGPQINVPVPRGLRRSQSDLPLGVQLIGRAGDDARVLAAAHWLEQQLKRTGG
ncbi:MAG TPA: amidase [Burkholderiaceae bacterium]|nr:amidase [Burkholderiaceae bacterium]